MANLSGRMLAALSFLGLAACASGGGGATTWREHDFVPLPMSGLAGVPVLIYPVVQLNIDSTADGMPVVNEGTRAEADSVIHAALARRTPQVPWISAAAIRRQAAAHDSLPDLEQVNISQISPRALTTVPQPLLGQMRALSGISSSRYSLVPAQVSITRRPTGAYRAELKLVIADTRVGGIGWASDVGGEGSDPWDAVGSAIWALTGAPRQ